MAANKVSVAYFLEDTAHEQFIPPLVQRLAAESPTRVSIREFILSAYGGSHVIRNFKCFLKDAERASNTLPDIVVVCVDANSKGAAKRYKELDELVINSRLSSTFVYAVPDPYIECWYLCDFHALQAALGMMRSGIEQPAKNDRNHYKQCLEDACLEAGIYVTQGGAEYGRDIVSAMDLYAASQREPSLKLFIEHMRAALQQAWHRITTGHHA